MGLAWNFLRDFEARRAPLVPVIDRPDYPDYTADPYIDENNAAYNADMRVIIFGVRFPRHSIARPVMKKPYGHIGRFPCDPGKNDRFIPDLLMETEYGRDMSKMLSALGDFRWNVTEPLPFFQALVQTDHSLAPRKLLTCVTRLLMDTGLSLDDIIASPATFVDRFSNYAEMRVAFADKKNPDKLLAGCPLTVPYLEDEDRSGYDNWYAYYTREIRRLLIMNNISTIPLDEFTSRNETEPENVDRLYRSSTGKICHIERPAEAFEEFPTIPSCSRFN